MKKHCKIHYMGKSLLTPHHDHSKTIGINMELSSSLCGHSSLHSSFHKILKWVWICAPNSAKRTFVLSGTNVGQHFNSSQRCSIELRLDLYAGHSHLTTPNWSSHGFLDLRFVQVNLIFQRVVHIHLVK